MNYKSFLLLILSLFTLSSCNTNFLNSSSDTTSSLDDISNESSEQIDLTTSWTNDDFDSYYDNLDLKKTSTLLSQLQSLNDTKQTSSVGYKNMRTKLALTDYDPNNSNNILSFYSGTSMDKTWDSGVTWNREHVWPNSRGGNLVEDDIHVIRPTLVSDNSNRGNSFYVEGKASSTSWDPKTAGLNEQYRGQTARIIFYCLIAEDSLKIVDKDTDATANKTMGKLSDLLKWNLEYEVAQTELNRNNAAEELQGNRNPFIDNPSLACAIWGDSSDSTRNICAGNYVKNEDNDNNSDVPTTDESTEKWTLVENVSSLAINDKIVFAYNTANVVAGSLSSTYLASVSASFSSDKKEISSLPSDVLIFDVGISNNYYTFTNNGQLLGTTATKKVAFDQGATTWSISINNGIASITSSSSTYGKLQYNETHPRFTTYASSMKDINIYKLIQ